MAVVMTGADPRKAAHAAVAAGADEAVPGRLRVRASAVRARRLLERAAAWRSGPGRWRARAAVATCWPGSWPAAGERVLDVQPKLAARVRLLAAGAVPKNDPNDARPVAVTALRSRTAREVVPDDHCTVVKVRSKRHRDPGRARTPIAGRLHWALRARPGRHQHGDHRSARRPGPGAAHPG